MRRARWKRKNVRDELTGKAVNSPKTGAGRHELLTELETPLPAALYLNLKSVRRRICGHGAQRGANRTPPAPLSAAAPPSNSGRGFQRGGALPSSPVPLGVGFQRRGPRPPAFVSFQGGAGGNRNPPAFLFRGPGGHSLFKREYPPGFSVPNRYSSAGNPGNFFGKTKRKWGFNPVRHSRTSPHQSGAFDVSKRKWGAFRLAKPAFLRQIINLSFQIKGELPWQSI